MKAKFGAIVVDGRGKIGGHVASKNRYGSFFRTKVTPSNPQTPYQSNARSLLAAISKAWGDLTDAQRAKWNSAVGTFMKTNVFGDAVKPTGKNLFTTCNINLVLAGQSQITTPPTPPSFPTVSIDKIGIQSGVAKVYLTSSPGSSYYIKIESTEPLPAGVSNVSNRYKLITVAAATTSPIAFGSEYTDRYGVTLAITDKIGVRCTLIDITTGICSGSFTFLGNPETVS